MVYPQAIGVLGPLPTITWSIDFSTTQAATATPSLPLPSLTPMSNVPNNPCPRPGNDTSVGNFSGAPLLSELDKCYYTSTCSAPELWEPGYSVKYRWFASGADPTMEVIENAFSNDLPLSDDGVQGLRTSSQGQFQRAVGFFFSDESMVCTIGGTECTPPTNQYDCDSYGSAGYNILLSYANLFNTISVIHTAMTDAFETIDLGAVNSTFWAPSQVPAPLDAQDFLNILLAFLGGFGGAVGEIANGAQMAESLWGRDLDRRNTPKVTPSGGNSTSDDLKALGSSAQSVISGVIGALPSNPEVDLDLQSALASIQNTSLNALETWSDAMFSKGEFRLPEGQTFSATFENYTGRDSNLMRIDDLMSEGALLIPPANQTSQAVRGNVTRILYMQLAEYSWQNDNGIVPFITWDDAPCGQVASVYLGDAIDQNRMLADVTQAQVTVDGRCYYLLSATPSECKAETASAKYRHKLKRGDPPPGWGVQSFPCCSVQLLPGGDITTLNGSTFSGLAVSDFVASSVATWNANDQKNGGNATAFGTDPSSFPQSLISAGMSNIPVCDYRNLDHPGVNCPDLTGTDSCPLLDSSS